MMRGASPVVVRGWTAWKKRMNLRYWGIFWSEGPSGEMDMNFVMLKTSEKNTTGIMWCMANILLLSFRVLS